jgi:uncharacterized protein YfiM (DUF2279 family)
MLFFKRLFLVPAFIFLLIFQNLQAAEKFNRALLCETTISAQQQKSHGDRWFGRDKGLHFVGSMISTVAVGKTSQTFFDQSKEQSLKIGVGFTFALGLGKEVWDSTKKNNKFSYKDLTADILGILMGSVLLNLE